MKQETTCCPKFEPAPWDETTLDFEGKLFMKDRVKSFFHIPLNFGAVMKRDMEKIEAAGAKGEEQVVLTAEDSLWGADVYTQVTKIIPGAKMSRIKGNFESKVFEGPYSKMGKFISQMKDYLRAKGTTLQGMLFYYPLCPKCAKKYGHNYIVILGSNNKVGLEIENL
ncbi:MAG: hypothetical protein OEY59_02185 [Deltaproteobacteria bacterium]|nr:hypothetical protein [Deltaproteobacteria bacterium]